MISQEEIDRVFEKDEEFNKRCNAFTRVINRIFEKKSAYVIIGILLIFAFLYIFCAPSIFIFLIRAVKVIGIILGIILMVFAGIYINVIIVSFSVKKKLLPSFIWCVEEIISFRLSKQLEKGNTSAEQKLIERKNRLKFKGRSIYSIFHLFSYYQKSFDNEKCSVLVDEARKLFGICKISDKIISQIEYSYALCTENKNEVIRLFEERQSILAENAFEEVNYLMSYLNDLAEYHYAKGEYAEALELFFHRLECFARRSLSSTPLTSKNPCFYELDVAKCCLKLDMLEEAKKHYATAAEFADNEYSRVKCREFSEELSKKENTNA